MSVPRFVRNGKLIQTFKLGWTTTTHTHTHTRTHTGGTVIS